MPFDLAQLEVLASLDAETLASLPEHVLQAAVDDCRRHPELRSIMDNQMADMEQWTPQYGYAYSNFPHKSTAPQPGCKSSCKTCGLNFLYGQAVEHFSYRRCLDDHEARQRLDSLTSDTIQNLEHVRKQLEHLGDTLLKRWQKCSPQKRATLLLQAMPDMYKYPGGLHREAEKSREYDEEMRSMYLLPWLNVEALSCRDDLVALLILRTTYSSEDWSKLDFHHTDYGFRMKLFAMEYNPHCVCMYGKSYGKLVPWGTAAFHRSDMISFTRAVLVLDAQNVLSTFMRNITDLLLDAKSGNLASIGMHKVQALLHAKQFPDPDQDVHEVSSMSSLEPPPTFNLDRVHRALRDRLRVAEDTLWLLQTDPVVAHEYLARIAGSVASELEDQAGVGIRLAMRMMTSIKLVEEWQYVVAECEHAMKIMDRAGKTTLPGQALPLAYRDAAGILEYVLYEHIQFLGRQLGYQIISSNAFNTGTAMKETGQIAFHVTHEQLFKDPIAWHIFELRRWTDKHSLPLSFHIEQLEGLLARASPAKAARVDQVMWNMISDMALAGDLLEALKCQRPRALLPVGITTPKVIVVETGDFGRLDSYDSMRWARQTNSPIIIAFMERNYKSLKVDLTHTISGVDHPYLELVPSLGAFLQSPRPEVQISRPALTALDRSHALLGDFWGRAKSWRRSRLRDYMGCGEEECDVHHFNIFMKPFQGRGHSMDLWEQERDALLAAIEAKEKPISAERYESKTGTKPTAASQAVREDDSSPADITVSLNKVKIKTRADVPAASRSEVSQNTNVDGKDHKPKFVLPVKKSSLTLFQRMFDPIMSNKVVKWSDLIAAISDAGFYVSQSKGSAVSFRKSDQNQKDDGTIVFHRPHPTSVVGPVMLREMGKRLRKWFGYGVETFVERT